MKKLHRLLFATLLVFSISSVFSQTKVFKKGQLTYKMDLKRVDPSYGEITVQSEINIMIMDQEMTSETKATVMGMSYSMSYTINRAKQSGILLIESAGGNYAAKITPADYLEFTKKQSEMINPEKVNITAETATIAGYKCKKAIVTNEDGIDATVYYTTELGVIEGAESSGLGIKGIEGIPLKISISGEDGDMTLEAVSIVKDKVDATKFKYDIPQGFTEMDYQTLSSGM